MQRADVEFLGGIAGRWLEVFQFAVDRHHLVAWYAVSDGVPRMIGLELGPKDDRSTEEIRGGAAKRA